MYGRLGIFASRLVGFMAGAWPVGGLLPLALLGCNLRLWKRDVKLLVLLGVLATTRGVWHIRVGHSPLLALAEVGLMWLIYQGQCWIQFNHPKSLSSAILWGLVVTVVWSIIQVGLDPLQWVKSDQVTVQKESNGVTRLIPINKLDASIQHVLGLRGPGILELSLELRSANALRLRLALYHPKLPYGGVERVCLVKKLWEVCSLKVTLPDRALVVLDLGGKRTWNVNDGTLEARNLIIQTQNNFAIFDYFANISRASAWAFNPNALGAGVVAVSTVALSSKDAIVIVFVLGISSVIVFLSGSRAALIVLFTAFSFFFLRNRNSIWFLTLIAVFVVITLSFGRFASTFDLNAESTQQRFTAFSNAFQAFQSAPLIGVGNFEIYALQQEAGLTHAHNLFLQTLAESGLIGLLPIIGLWVLAFARAFKRRAIEATLVFTVILSLNLFDYLFYFAPLQFAFWWAFAKVEPNGSQAS